MKQQETIAGRIVKNVNKVLEVIPRTLNSEADVIKLNFQKARKTKRSATARKSKNTSKARRGVRVKARAKTAARKARTMAATAKRKPVKSMRKNKTTPHATARAA